MKVYEDFEPNATPAEAPKTKKRCITCLYARGRDSNPESDICRGCDGRSNYKSKTARDPLVCGKKAFVTNGASKLVEAGKAIDRDIDEAIRKDLPYCTRSEDNRDMCFVYADGFCVNKDGTCEDQDQKVELLEHYQKEAESIRAKMELADSITIAGKNFVKPEVSRLWPKEAEEILIPIGVGPFSEEDEFINGFPNPLHVHDELCKAAREIMMKKNHDYTSGSGDPYANFRGSTSLDISNIKGILLRVQDKMKRIQTFDEKGELRVKDESVQDAIIDVINYMVLIGGLIKEIQHGTEEKTEEAQEY